MPLYPGNYEDEYNISDIKKGSSAKNRGFGQDTSQNTDNIIYISSVPLERTIAFKAFIESFKLNLTREQEIGSEIDKISQTVVTHKGELSYDITLNVPAHSTNDSKNNIAKIAELQKLILPVNSKEEIMGSDIVYSTISNNTSTVFPLFKVWFKNLISNGFVKDKMPLPSDCNYDDIDLNGFTCMIQDVSYEPDMEQGFFDFQNYLYPKNIKLTLKLEYVLDNGSLSRNIYGPILGFKLNGQYEAEDGCFFPFCVRVKSDIGSLRDGGYASSFSGADYSTADINKIDFNNHNDSYLFISIPQTGGSHIDRWVVFHSFFESFSRTMGSNLPIFETKTSTIGKILTTAQPSSEKPIVYKIRINVPSKNLDEAKRNCAKIQYLARMFFKTNYSQTQQDLIESLQLMGSESISESSRKLRFYSPSFIEKPNASQGAPSPSSFNAMYDNSILMAMNNLSIDIELEQGFFEDKKGFQYPKAFSVDMEMSYTDGGLQKNYELDNRIQTNIKYRMIEGEAGVNKGFEHLFPYNRQTSKITIGN